MLEQLSCRAVDIDADPEIGALIEADIPDIGRQRFLRVRCGTGRELTLCVPPDMETAIQANAWTYDIDPDLMRRIEVRT